MWWWTIGSALAQSTIPDPFMAEDLGYGGAVRANPTAFGASVTAPAVIALQPNYTLAAGGRLGSEQVRRIEGGAIDSMTGPIALGAMYIREDAEREATIDELPGWLRPNADTLNPQLNTIVGGGLATSFMERRLAVGAGVRYQRFASRFTDATGTFQAFASVAGRLREGIFLSLSAENLIPSDDLDPGAAMAVRFANEDRASLAAELLSEFGDSFAVSEVRTGAEVKIGEYVPVRAGYRRHFVDQTDTVSLGLGVGTQEAMFEYGVSLELESWEQLHALNLRIFF